MTGHLESPASSSSSPSSKRPRKSLILCQLVLADSVVPLGSRQGLTRPDATFVALSTVTALTAETKFAPHTLGVSRARGPSPRRCAVHVSGLDRERTAHGGWIAVHTPLDCNGSDGCRRRKSLHTLLARSERVHRVRVGALYTSMYSVSCRLVVVTRSPFFGRFRRP